jgi:hypothetical protein
MSGQQGGESPSGTIIRDYTDIPITDQYGNQWSISRSKQVMIDGVSDRTTSGVTELAYINRTFWQWVADKRLWWSKTSPLAPWLPPQGTTDAPFGPIPDPRLDQIITAIGSLAQADGAAFGLLAARVETLQSTVDNLPPPAPPDPRIAALFAAVLRGFERTNAHLSIVSDATVRTQETLETWEAAANARFDALDAAQVAIAAKQDALAGQIDRVITLLLDLFPDKPTVRIVLGEPTFTTQPAPTDPGP